jgi:hypothetical protein
MRRGRRRIEIIAIERERTAAARPDHVPCPVCHLESRMLTPSQAAVLAQVKTESIHRWLAGKRVHGVKTPDGHHLICSSSVFTPRESANSLGIAGKETLKERGAK